MAISVFERLQSKMDKVNNDDIYNVICRNIKRFRLQRYYEFKEHNYKEGINPFSTENISALLDYNHNHYKRFESETDSTKRIPLDKLVRLSIILDKNIDDFINNG